MSEAIFFTQPAIDILEFEQAIAFFYGAKNPDKMAHHYLAAIKQLEKLGIDANDNLLVEQVLPFLVKAYQEVLMQTDLIFDVDKAARYEMAVILSQARKAFFEDIYTAMLNLYQEVYNSDAFSLQKAAMLRTFLYQYKIAVLQPDKTLSENDKKIMIAMANLSAEQLKNRDLIDE